MKFMNEYDIEHANTMAAEQRLPNIYRGTVILARLMAWTNDHSDGWPYWKLPAKAAAKLMTLIEDSKLHTGRAEDVTEAQLKASFTPIKSFLTRQKVDHSEVFRS